MKPLTLAPILILGLSSWTFLCAEIAGELRIEAFHSHLFKNDRKLRIWLPSSYASTFAEERRYPVLYLNDGQNLFDRQTAQFSEDEWQVDETVSELIRRREIPEIIVIGIDNAGKRLRPAEYLPWEDVYLSPPVRDPEGRNYPRFLLEEVIPFVTSRYRVRTDPAGRGLGGSSYGALAALYAVTTRPGEFGMLLLESPSLYVNQTQVLNECQNLTEWPARVSLGVGTHEGRDSCDEDPVLEAVQDVQRLEGIIRRNVPGTHLRVIVERCGLHNEATYGRRFAGAVRFLFGKSGPKPSN